MVLSLKTSSMGLENMFGKTKPSMKGILKNITWMEKGTGNLPMEIHTKGNIIGAWSMVGESIVGVMVESSKGDSSMVTESTANQVRRWLSQLKNNWHVTLDVLRRVRDMKFKWTEWWTRDTPFERWTASAKTERVPEELSFGKSDIYNYYKYERTQASIWSFWVTPLQRRKRTD